MASESIVCWAGIAACAFGHWVVGCALIALAIGMGAAVGESRHD